MSEPWFTERPKWAGPGWEYRVVTIWEPTGETRIVHGPETLASDSSYQMLTQWVDGMNRLVGPGYILQRAPAQNWETVWPQPEHDQPQAPNHEGPPA